MFKDTIKTISVKEGKIQAISKNTHCFPRKEKKTDTDPGTPSHFLIIYFYL